MYLLRSQITNTYFYKKIDGVPHLYTFECPEHANYALQLFQEYCMQELLITNRIFEIPKVTQISSSYELIPLTEEVQKTQKFISFEKAMEEKGCNF